MIGDDQADVLSRGEYDNDTGTEFFPVDFMDESPEKHYVSVVSRGDLMDLDRKLEFLKGYLKNEKLANLVVDLDEAISTSKRGKDEYFLLNQNYIADLVWLAQELKGILAHWGDNEYEQVLARERIKTLSLALDRRIVEVR